MEVRHCSYIHGMKWNIKLTRPAIAIANQDHGIDGYVGEALILILILAIARTHGMGPAHEQMLMGLANEQMLIGQA